MGEMVIVQGHADLPDVILATGSPGALPGRLNCR
jgi:hypothetical protein